MTQALDMLQTLTGPESDFLAALVSDRDFKFDSVIGAAAHRQPWTGPVSLTLARIDSERGRQTGPADQTGCRLNFSV
jgi:hypothetical protein